MSDTFRKSIERNSLAFWFPKIQKAGLPVPKTLISEPMPMAAREQVWKLFDQPGEKAETPELDAYFDDVRRLADKIGYPCFLRSTHTSAKHEWRRTCHVTEGKFLRGQALNIAYHSECVAMMGELPWDQFAVREMLPTVPIGVCTDYGGMPIQREFRCFANEGEMRCSHPYWPRGALVDGGAHLKPGQYEQLCSISEGDLRCFIDLSVKAAKACGGGWSVDFLDTTRGWVIIDMAEAARSFHWEGCPHA